MNQSSEKYQHVVRHVYTMMVILIVLSLIAFTVLYFIHSSDRRARERITLYHAQSSALAQQLQRSNQTILEQLDDSAPDAAATALSLTRRAQPGPEVRATIGTMSQRVGQLQALQSQYGGKEFGATLERVAHRLDGIDQALDEVPAPASVRDLLLTFDLLTEQLYRQHDIAAIKTFDEIDEISRRVLPSFGVVGFLLVMIGLTTWVTARQLRSALARQVDIETELADSQERMHHMQKLDALGQLVGGIAHDFNNLLTAILGHAGLLLDKPGLDKDQEFGLSQIRQAGEQAAGLTRQLLAFGRPEATEARVFDPSALIRDYEDLLRRLIGESVQLTIQSVDNLGLVEMDPGQMQQVVLNLAVNARDAMPDGGQLTIAFRNVDIVEPDMAVGAVPNGRYVKLAVIDTGTGMDKETRDRIFDPYFTTKPKNRGTGLGLSTVHGIITSAGGHIRVYSRPGSGSRFEILLPVSQKAMAMPAVGATPEQQCSGTETILVVEDEEQIRSFLKDGLGSLGYRVLTAEDAVAGLKICSGERGDIDVIVSDVVLPQTNGVDFLKDAQQLRPSAQGIFISGYTDDILLHNGVESADTPLIYKPFELTALAGLIRQRLDHDNAN